MQNVIEELKRIQAAVTNLIEVLESSPENKTVSATVGEIRSVAILGRNLSLQRIRNALNKSLNLQ